MRWVVYFSVSSYPNRVAALAANVGIGRMYLCRDAPQLEKYRAVGNYHQGCWAVNPDDATNFETEAEAAAEALLYGAGVEARP